MRVSFVVQAANDEEGESALQALAELFIDGPDVLTYEGIKMTFADPACGIEVDSVCRNAVATPGTVLTVVRDWVKLAMIHFDRKRTTFRHRAYEIKQFAIVFVWRI